MGVWIKESDIREKMDGMSTWYGEKGEEKNGKVQIFWACVVKHFSNMFSVFKQYYSYFYTHFYPHIFQKNTNNITLTILPNSPF